MQTMITSTKNPRVQALRELRQAKGRQDCYLAEGVKLVREALRYAQVETVLADAAQAEAFAPLLSQAPDVLLAPAHVVAAVCDAKTPQGICAAVRLPAPLDLDAAHGALLVLDGVQDPGNVGTMIRTAEAAGFSGVLLSPACADAFAPKTVRATMGSIFRVPIWRGALGEALAGLQGRGFSLVATAMDGQPPAALRRRVQLPLALLIGSEGSGLSPALLDMADHRASLPMRGQVESLNAAVAAGLLMYGLLQDAFQ